MQEISQVHVICSKSLGDIFVGAVEANCDSMVFRRLYARVVSFARQTTWWAPNESNTSISL